MKLNNSKFAGQDAGDEWFDRLTNIAEWFEAWAAFHREARHNFLPSADRIIQVTEGCANRNDFLIRTVGILWNIKEHYIMNCAECTYGILWTIWET